MPKFDVELQGWALVRRSVQVEAEDCIAAKQSAVEHSGASRPEWWEVIDHGSVTRVDATWAEEMADDEPICNDQVKGGA